MLAHSQAAVYLVSEARDWGLVPRTEPRDGAADELPEAGYRTVLGGEDEEGNTVALIHEDTPALRRMAVFVAIVNNADRKGFHVLAMPDGHRFGVDHGLTFHEDHKLRTVLWGWVGQPLTAEELDGVDRVLAGIDGQLGRELTELLTAEEVAALAERCVRLRAVARFPAPASQQSAVPWPLF